MSDLIAKSDKELGALRVELVSRLAEAADYTPGAFQEEWGRCGKSNCHCHQEGDPGHGPRYSVMRYELGKPVKRTVPARLAVVVRQRVERWGVFKSLVDSISAVNAEVSRRMLLDHPPAVRPAPPIGGEKGGSTS